MQRLPPPPPPPPAVPSTSRSQMDNPVYCGMGQTPGPVHLAMQHLQPPPPPPPLAVPSTSRSQMHNPVYLGQTPQPSTSFATCHSPTAVPIFRFDARRPPPPIHTHVQLNNNNLTRTMSHSCTAPPSKLRRMEEPKPDDALCDVCVQREICIEICRIKMENLSAEHESQSLLNRKKLIEYQKHKDFLRSLVNSKLFRKIEEYVEDVPQNNIQSVLNNLNDSLLTGHSSSNPNQSSQSVRAEDSLLQTSAMTRSVSRSSPDVLQTLQEMLSNENRSSSSERPRHGELTIERGQSSSSNGVSSFHPYSNAQSQSNGRRSSPAYAIAPASAPVAPPAAPAALPAPPPAVTYPHYTPPPPVTYPYYPPSRSYYPHPYLPSPTPTTSRAPMPPRPPHREQYPPPYYY